MGIADAGVDMMPCRAAPATKPIVRAFTGTSLIVVACRQVTARPDRRGLETGGRDFPRRTGLGRVMSNSSVPAQGCISQLKIHPVAVSLGVPTRRRGRRAGTCTSTVERGHPHGPAFTLSHGRSTLG